MDLILNAEHTNHNGLPEVPYANGKQEQVTCAPSRLRKPGKKDAHVLVIVTGGTIAMKNRNGVYVPESNYINQVIEMSPVLHDKEAQSVYSCQGICDSIGKTFVLPQLSKTERRVIYCMYEYEVLLDSSNMTVDDYRRIAGDIKMHYENFDGFVVLHGTDTMAYSASYLSFMMENLGKSVILTGAQVPLCATRSDGVDNLLAALLITGNYTIPEITLFFHHRLYRGNRVTKVDTESFQAFDSPNMEELVTMGVEIKVNWDLVWRSNIPKPFSVFTGLEQNVGLLRIFPGITASTVRAFLNPPIKGVVLQTYGSGNGPSSREDILTVLSDASQRGVLIVNCTQCVHGRVTPSYEPGKIMEDIGIVSGHDMTPEAALAKLAYVAGKEDLSHEEKVRTLKQNLRGELTKEEVVSEEGFSFVDALAASLRLNTKEERKKLQDVLFPPILCFSAQTDNVASLEKMRAQGADLCAPDYDGRTPLHVAASEGHEDAVRYLLSKGATVYAQDRFGNTPLEDAIQFKRFKCIELLREAGAHLSNLGKGLGVTFCSLASNNDVKGLVAWSRGGADMTSTDYMEQNALHVAAKKGFHDIIKFLLNCGVDPSAMNIYGATAFDMASDVTATYMSNFTQKSMDEVVRYDE